jgi:acyl carrier protein
MERDQRWKAIFEKVQEIIADKLRVDTAQLSSSKSLVDHLGVDSLNLIEFIMAYEEEFGIKINDEDTDNVKTIGATVDLLYRLGAYS